MTQPDGWARRMKTRVALASVGAAVGLTTLKLSVGVVTGSLGILAEAAHSGLDLVAALLTFFAVSYAERPPDASHNYGHGKMENLSAFLEAGLLLLTALWVIYEAVRRLIFHEGHVTITFWSFAVMIIAIIVDATRSRVLLRVARRVGSQALEADALHFSTDIWSSGVVIVGLAVVALTRLFALPGWLGQADAIAALGVSAIVIWVSLRLTGETIDALLDRAPEAVVEAVRRQVAALHDVLDIRRVRVRRAGNKFFADLVIAAPRTLTFEQTHALTEQCELAARAALRATTPQAEIDVVVHIEPTTAPTETVRDRIHYLTEEHGLHAHDIHVREVDGRLEAVFDLEVPPHIALGDADAIASRLEADLLAQDPRLARVVAHLEAPETAVMPRANVTAAYPDLVARARQIARAAGAERIEEISLLRSREPHDEEDRAVDDLPALDIILVVAFDRSAPLDIAHTRAEAVKRALHQALPQLETITVRTVPLREHPAVEQAR